MSLEIVSCLLLVRSLGRMQFFFFFSWKNMDLVKLGIKIFVFKSFIKSRIVVDGFQSESFEKLDFIEQGQEDIVVFEVVVEKFVGVLLGFGVERVRMGSRFRIYLLVFQVFGFVIVVMVIGLVVNGKGIFLFMDVLIVNGIISIQIFVIGVIVSKRKFIDDRRDQFFDK